MGGVPPDQECQRSVNRETGRSQRTSVTTTTRQSGTLGVLSDKEESFRSPLRHRRELCKRNCWIGSNTIPQTANQRPQESQQWRKFPCWSSCPFHNLFLSIPKDRMCGIKRILDNNEAHCMSKIKIQASDLRQRNLENQGITCNNSTAASTDAESFQPSENLKPVTITSPKNHQKKTKLTWNTAWT